MQDVANITDQEIVLIRVGRKKPIRVSGRTYKNFLDNPKFKDKVELVQTDLPPVEKKKKSNAVEGDFIEKLKKAVAEKNIDDIEKYYSNRKKEISIDLELDENQTNQLITDVKNIETTKSAQKLIEENNIDLSVFIGLDKVKVQDVRDYLKKHK